MPMVSNKTNKNYFIKFLPKGPNIKFWVLGLLIFLLIYFAEVHANVKLPGSDSSDKLEAAGTLLRLIDTGLFKWGARIFAGMSILTAGWSLKEQRFAMAVISVIGAVIIGTSPMWVKNIFDIGGGGTLFN